MLFNVNQANRVVFIFAALGIGFLALFTTVVLINNKTFVDKVYYRTIVDNAKGLSAKPPINFKGIEIGRVSDFQLNELTNDIEVDFFVYADYQSKVVRFAILADNKSILINNATEFELIMPSTESLKYGNPLTPGSLVPFISSGQAQTYIRRGLIEVPANSVDSIVASVNNLLLNFQRSDNPEAGSLFRVLDTAAKISDQLLLITEEMADTGLLESAEQIVSNTNQILTGVPQSQERVNSLLDQSEVLLTKLETVLSSYQDPAAIVKDVSNGQVPEILDNVNQSLVVLKEMINEVHAERLQLMVTMNTVLKVLNKMDKTLEGVNNNPLLKGGIEKTPPPKGIETND